MVAGCSTAEVTTCRRAAGMVAAVPRMARLLDSVPPEVNTISSGWAPIRAATCSRAVSTAAFAARPKGWSLDGLPKWVVR